MSALVSAPEEVISVAELTRRLKRAVEGTTGREWVEGEVSSLKRAGSGHAYFTLKDERDDACVECVMYKFWAQRARKILQEGARLQLLGRATIWPPRGRLQLVCESARPSGKGALLEALEQLKQRLAKDGLFAQERKRSLPTDPHVVGVVTSAAGAAFHDICTVAFRRASVRIVLSPARVQGERAVDQIVRAIDLVERHPDLDVLIVGRGGGSGEDLMAFNDERVVRRIAATRVPVVSAVGHEIDVTLTDLAADLRAATPSQAAELVIPDARARLEELRRMTLLLWRSVRSRVFACRSRVERLKNELGDPRLLVAERQQRLDERTIRLERLVARSLARRRTALEQLHRRLLARHPRIVIARAHAELGPLRARLGAAMKIRLGKRRERLAEHAARLDGLSPLAVLGRGYSITSFENGGIVRAATEVAIGTPIGIRLQRGQLAATVTAVDNDEEGR